MDAYGNDADKHLEPSNAYITLRKIRLNISRRRQVQQAHARIKGKQLTSSSTTHHESSSIQAGIQDVIYQPLTRQQAFCIRPPLWAAD